MSLVSVVIPTYNRAQVLPRAIDSVLNQTYQNLELIVVDDASTDSTKDVVTSYQDERICYIQHEVNKNGSVARNTGIQAATGEYIAFLDSDDEWYSEKLRKQVSQLESRSEKWVANYCGVEVKRNSKLQEVLAELFNFDATHEGQEEIIRGLLTVTGYVHGGSTILAKRSAVEDINGFDESFLRHQDIEFTIRLAKVGKIGYVDEILVTLHDSGEATLDTVVDAKKNLFDAFEEDINYLESKGYEVRKIHRFALARCYIRDGLFRESIHYLLSSKPANFRQLLGLGLDIARGIKEIIF